MAKTLVTYEFIQMNNVNHTHQPQKLQNYLSFPLNLSVFHYFHTILNMNCT